MVFDEVNTEVEKATVFVANRTVVVFVVYSEGGKGEVPTIMIMYCTKAEVENARRQALKRQSRRLNKKS